MAEPKTKPTQMSVADYLAAVEHPVRRADAQMLCDVMAKISGAAPAMWGPSIIGFGTHHYRYDSGREGEMCRIGFAPRKAELVLYGLVLDEAGREPLDRLGKHKTGKGCLYIKKLADVDMAVLEAMIAAAWARRA